MEQKDTGGKKRIAFVKYLKCSNINDRIRDQLQRAFPDCVVEMYDIADLILRPDFFFMNGIAVCLEFWRELLTLRRHPIEFYLFTEYLFRQVDRWIAKSLSGKDYLFTFQSQSFFNAKQKSIPNFVYTDHNMLVNRQYPYQEFQSTASDAWIAEEKRMYHDASLNFVMGSHVKRSLIDEYGCSPDKVFVVGAGYNAAVEPVRKKRYGKDILFVGVDWERKGGPTLAKAFEIVLDKHPDASLTVVGCSPKLSLKNCRVVGRVPLSEMKGYYTKASIFCMPTLLEPFGIVFIEAMAYRLPVVGTNIGAVPDFIKQGKNGYVVEPRDPVQLASALIDLLDSPSKCDKMGREGQKIALKEFSWDSVGDRFKKYISIELRL